MHGLTGVELSKEILKTRPDMPIIICTGYSSIISEENFLAIGIKTYLKKPISTKRLAISIRQVIDEN
jgi:DNA-binding NtrC family response regulator